MSTLYFIFAGLSAAGAVIVLLGMTMGQLGHKGDFAGLASGLVAAIALAWGVIWALGYIALGLASLFVGESIKTQIEIAENTRRAAESVAELVRCAKSQSQP